jgi:hypothetical protein
VNLRLGKAKDQNAGSFDEPDDECIGIGIEFDSDVNGGIKSLGDLVCPGLDFRRRCFSSLCAQHRKKEQCERLFLFVQRVDKTALVQLADEAHIDKLLGLGCLRSRIALGDVL